MSDTFKIVRIFIGSPGGLDEERQAAHEVVDSVNRSHSEQWGCRLELLRWENAIPGYVRPQSKINEDLDKCDYFLGVLWDKWGSQPTTDADGYTSGFEEEFIRARTRIESGLMKDLAIYFKDIEVPSGMQPGKEIKKVLKFRQKCIDEKKVFFKGFTDIQSFRDVVREKLNEIGWRETEIVRNKDQLTNQSERTPLHREKSKEQPSQETWLIDEEAREFLTEISQRTSDWKETAAHEIARFRLIATAIMRSGNDESYLGNHDANKFFQNLRDGTLSAQEIRALLDCGIVGFQQQNVPLWHWIARAEKDGDWFDRVRVLAAIGNESERKNAIKVLGIALQPIPTLGDYFNKTQVLTNWLSDKTDNQTFDAAVSFLSSNADHDDISLIEEVTNNCLAHRRAKIETAVVGILSRTSADAALKRLVEKEVDKIEKEVTLALFRSPQSLATDTMILCLSANSEGVRLRAAQILFERDEVALSAAESLLTDSNHEIRLIAAESLKKLGHELDHDLVRKALTIVKQPTARGFSLFQRNETDASYHERYLSNRLAELNLPALKAKVAEAGAFNNRELSALYSKYSSQMKNEIRENLKDSFKRYFDATIQKGVDADRMSSIMVSRIKKLEKFQRKQHCTNALAVLCGMAKSQDLNLVRKTLDEIEVDAKESILAYLARFGDWSDISRVTKLGDYSNNGAGLFRMQRTELPDQKAGAILGLGRVRIADLLAVDLDGSIRKSLAKQLPKKVFVDLADDILMRELNRDDDEYRIVFALRCVQSLSKSRVTSLLNRYLGSDEHRYYNCVHWLDLGASLPQRLVKTIVERELLHH